MMQVTKGVVLILSLLISTVSASAELYVAVASNFAGVMSAIAEQFEKQTGHQVRLVFGSTGKHYAQIQHGAPYDAFFAADDKRPILLEREGIALGGSRFTYAMGKLVLWSPEASLVDAQGKVLQIASFRYLAIANPRLAPYGRAAKQVLAFNGLWEKMQSRIVMGENIGQTYQFVKSGNAALGFVSYSQVLSQQGGVEGSMWMIPSEVYLPIVQQAVLIKDNTAARALLKFIQEKPAREMIEQYGYGLP